MKIKKKIRMKIKKDAPKPAERPASARKKSSNGGSNGGACADYVQCICDLGDEMDGKQGVTKPADCAEVKKLYGALGSMGSTNKVCEDMLKGLKDGFTSMAPLYKMNGVNIPASCKN